MELKVLKGGRSESLFSEYRFLSGEITNTRLMGVLGMHIHWALPYPTEQPNLHQFYYYDVEELGLDSISTYNGDDPVAIELAGKNVFGGLGATMVSITEREARYLANEFVIDTRRKGNELPDEVEDIEFITKLPVILSPAELKALNEKLCVEPRSDYEAINYFLMRQFGHDESGARLLVSEAASPKAIGNVGLKDMGTFLKNTIEEYEEPTGRHTYLCESLVQDDASHWLVTSELELKDRKVVAASKRNAFKISIFEASLMLSRFEYVTVYEILQNQEDFDVDFTAYSVGTVRTGHDNGEMFMEFKKNNDHVNQRVFNLSDDVSALYYVTDFGQLIVAAYSLGAISAVELKLHISNISAAITPTARYQFQEPVLYEFSQSDYDDFEEFLKSLQ